MSEWTRTLLISAVMAMISHVLIRLGVITFESFVVWNVCVVIAWLIRRTP